MATGQKDIDAGLLAMKKGLLDTNIAILEYTKTMDDIVSADYIKKLEDIVAKNKAELALETAKSSQENMSAEVKANISMEEEMDLKMSTDMVQLAKSQNAPAEFVKNLENVLGTTTAEGSVKHNDINTLNLPIGDISPELRLLLTILCGRIRDGLAKTDLKGQALKDAIISHVDQGIDEMVTDIVDEIVIDSVV